MKRALWAVAAVVATAALLAPLVATAKKNDKNPRLSIEIEPGVQIWPRLVTVTGDLKVQDAANQPIELQANPHPYTGAFKTIEETTTNADGEYTFSTRPDEHTNYRVNADLNPDETSGVLNVRSRMKITRRVDDRTPVDGQEITFSGRVSPDHEGELVYIQRRRPSGTWKTMTTTPLGPMMSDGTSAYSDEFVVNRDGRWRARVKRDDNHLGNKSRSVFINVVGE